MVSPHLKNMIVKLDIFPKPGGRKENIFELLPTRHIWSRNLEALGHFRTERSRWTVVIISGPPCTVLCLGVPFGCPKIPVTRMTGITFLRFRNPWTKPLHGTLTQGRYFRSHASIYLSAAFLLVFPAGEATKTVTNGILHDINISNGNLSYFNNLNQDHFWK